ncbi:MAG: DUF1934 domain-containing protein [Clostridia bacterium]|nr:DUF1934 domain-containing protein [Clostridia bacterium]
MTNQYENEKKAMITITSTHSDLENAIQTDFFEEIEEEQQQEPEVFEMTTEGVIRTCDGRLEIEYFETELTGMEGACTCVSYALDNPGIVTMLRTGTVETALTFEEGHRNVCVYNTEDCAFEVTVCGRKVVNDLTLDGGEILLSYGLEIRGVVTELTTVLLTVHVCENGGE